MEFIEDRFSAEELKAEIIKRRKKERTEERKISIFKPLIGLFFIVLSFILYQMVKLITGAV